MLEDAEDGDIESVDITIPPLNGGAGSDSDGDSDDEMFAKGDPNSLSRNKLLAEACVQVQRRHGGTSTYLIFKMMKSMLKMKKQLNHLLHNHQSKKQNGSKL